MLTDSLFEGFDPDIVAAIARQHVLDTAAQGEARAHRSRTKHQARRATAEKHLAEILPATFADGDSWHVISRGDIDALSYLQHALAAMPFDRVLLSTWCMAEPDLVQLRAWLDTGRIDQLDLYVGEIFPSQYSAEYTAALALADDFGARIVIARNHSKVICAGNESADYFLVMEGSANVNTNPRIEQTTITRDRALFDFYLDFFNGLRSIDKRAAG